MKDKFILVWALVLLLFSLCVVHAVDLNSKYKNNLKRALFEELKQYENKTFTLDETKALVDFYLDGYDVNDIDWDSVSGQLSTEKMKSLISRLLNAYTKAPDTSTCTEGWKCKSSSERGYQNTDCSWSSVSTCQYGCSLGVCKTQVVACFAAEDCPLVDSYKYCLGNQLCTRNMGPICMNAGTVNAYCGQNETTQCAACENGCDTNAKKCIELKTGCGNNIKESGEICDGTDLGGKTCQSLGYDSGLLHCTYNCAGFDTADCVTNPTCNSCSDCDTIFSSCTYQECKHDCGTGCYYRGAIPLIEDCIELSAACTEIMSCKDYSPEECTSNPCGLSPRCSLTGTSCVEVSVEPGKIRFAVIGDFGTGDMYERQVADLVKSWNPDFIITTGDNNYQDGAASTIDRNIGQFYSNFIYPYRGSFGSGDTTNRFFPSLGNHDWVATNAQPYLDYFTLPGNERYYDFIKGPVHFFAIDSDVREPDGATSSSIQGQWLKNKLSASTAPFNLVYFHEAPYGSFRGENYRMQWPFKEWGADVVLSGHDHIYERFLIDGFPYFVNGLGGADMYDFNYLLDGSQKRYNQDRGAMLIEATSDSMNFKFVTYTGKLIDSYTIGMDNYSSPLPSAAVTFQQLKDDITLPHELSPLPIIPTSWGWSYHGWPYQDECGPKNMPDDGRDYYNPWGQIFPDPSTPTNLNAGFELGKITFYIKLKSTGEWYTYEHGEVSDGYIFYGQSALPEVPGTSYSPIRGPGGGLFYKLGMGNWQQNQGAHFWPPHSHEFIDNPDVEHVAVSITGRIALQNPNGVDDRAKAKYLIGIGVDHRYQSGNSPIIEGVLMSRHRYLTNEWQTFTMHSICPDMVEIEKPPIHGRTW